MSIKDAAEQVRRRGRRGDTELVHMTRDEVAALRGLAKAAGGKLTRNPDTGLPEASFLGSLLPTVFGAIANTLLPGSGMVVGGITGALQNKENPLMGAITGGMGGYGGGNLAAGLQGVGAGAAQQAAQAAALPGAQAAQVAADTAAIDAAILGGPYTPAPDVFTAPMNQAAADATTQFLDKPFYSQAGEGIAALFQPGGTDAFTQGMGGLGNLAKSGLYASAPLLYDAMQPEQQEVKRPGSGEARRYSYDAGYTGGEMTGPDISSERDWFDPVYTRMAEGGAVQAKTSSGAPAFNFNQSTGQFTRQMQPVAAPAAAPAQADPSVGLDRLSWRTNTGINPAVARFMQGRMGRGGRRFAEGGVVEMESGGFVIPADVVSMAGGGSTDAGLAALAQRIGARPIKGAGDGQSDDIPATIDGKPVARVANGEAYVPAPVAKKVGVRKLYKMLDNVRGQAHGTRKQQRPVNLDKALA